MDQTYEIDDATLATLEELSEDEFNDYLNTGTIPNSKNNNPKSSKKGNDEVEETTNDDSQELEETPTEVDETETEEVTEEDQEEVDSTTTESNEETDDTKADDEEATKVDDAFRTLFSKPIKANGTEITLSNMQEVTTLIQKGVNYEAKNKELKPAKKLLKTLEANNLKEEDINLLIDLKKGNKEAIKTLIDANNIESYDLDSVDTTNYKPNNSIVSDTLVDLDEYLDIVKKSPHANEVADLMNNWFEPSSKELIIEHPSALTDILQELESGRFLEVKSKIEKEYILGQLNKPRIVRYIELVQEMEQAAKLKATELNKEAREKVKSSVKPSIKSTKQSKPTEEKPSMSLIEMENLTDEEFAKLFG